uniref:Uncharacterized protein n=1 Tax=Magnetococcus massalia (strain MO-1) TaxID=451514 RepID=A0A1S7LKG9_MAGMO|nr:membrane protein of unknown function [Candidatus Magnetococcus massalia]
MNLEVGHLLALLGVAIGAAIAVLTVRSNRFLGLYLWVILCGPYLFAVGTSNVRAAVVILPFFVVALVLERLYLGQLRNLLREPLYLGFLLLTGVMVVTSAINFGMVTGATVSYFIYWFLAFGFFTLFLTHLSRLTSAEVDLLADQVIRALVWFGVLACAIAWVEYFWPKAVHDFFNPEMGEQTWGSRNDLSFTLTIRRGGSMIGAPNAFGLFLVIASIAAWNRWLKERAPLFLMVQLFFVISLLIHSNSRAALGLFILFGLWLLLQNRHYLFLLLAGGLVGVVGVALWPFIEGLLHSGAHYIESDGGIGRDIPIIGTRVSIWAATVFSLLAEPLHIFTGFGHANEVMVKFIGKQTAHNIPLSLIHFYGLFGFLLVLTMAWKIMRVAWRWRLHDGLFERSVFFFSLAHLLSGMVDAILFNPLMIQLNFALLALGITKWQHEKRGHHG